MSFAFYVVDEADLNEAALKQAAQQSAAPVIDAVLEQAGRWGGSDVEIETFAELFVALGRVIGKPDFLADLAFAGSPWHVLVGVGGRWRFGYFEASLVQHLQPALNMLHERVMAEIAPLGQAGADALDVFQQALGEAFLRHRAVAVLHED